MLKHVSRPLSTDHDFNLYLLSKVIAFHNFEDETHYWVWPALSSRWVPSALLICSRSLVSFRYNQTEPFCWGSSKVKRRPALFHVRNCSARERFPDDQDVSPGSWRKLWASVKVTAMETGSAQEKVTLPWEKMRSMGMKTWIIKHKYALITEAGVSLWLWRRGLIRYSLGRDTCITTEMRRSAKISQAI